MKRARSSTAPVVANTHVHVPPNASTDNTLDSLLTQARSEGLRVVGSSNFFDMQVLPEFTKRALEQGIYPLLGIEIITYDRDLEAAGWTVNDPQNPGRYYLQGRGLSAARVAAGASATARSIRSENDARAERQVALLSELMVESGLSVEVTAAEVVAEVASRSEVPNSWVSLQERHIARAFADRLLALDIRQRRAVLERAIGRAPRGDLNEAGDLQTEIRATLLKHGQAAFVPDSPITLADGYAMVLELGGIPTYCAVADGASPICDYERPAIALAARIRDRNMQAAELVTARNTRRCVDEYVAAFQDSGLLVMAGSEHNTPHRVPMALTCADGPLSEFAAGAFWEGACVVAAHQDLVARGELGFVDQKGELQADAVRRRELSDYGAALIAQLAENS